jgi:drug/metabolite transporter (DMT)-like permease
VTSSRQLGLLFLLITSFGWGLNWPVIKLILQEWPPLFARGAAGLVAALGLGVLAVVRGQRLSVPHGTAGRLAIAAMLNVFGWMGLSTLAMVWLTVSQGTLLVYTMPIWAMLLAWPVRGERPTLRGIGALGLGVLGLCVLLGGPDLAIGLDKLPGVVFALGAAISFALGTVAMRVPLPLPPLALVSWQVGLGCLPMVIAGILFERPQLEVLSGVGWAAMIYMTVVPMGICYLSWFAALRRLPPATASMATLLTPVIGVLAATPILGEPLGAREVLALGLTLAGVSLALPRAKASAA